MKDLYVENIDSGKVVKLTVPNDVPDYAFFYKNRPGGFFIFYSENTPLKNIVANVPPHKVTVKI